MKKKLTTLMAATLLFMSAAFANNTEPSLQVQTEFNRFFAKPTDVKWEAVSNFYVATFEQGGEHLIAYFNPMGRLESVARDLRVDALPLLLQKELQDKLSGAWVSENVELSGSNGTEYYVTLENAGATTVYRASNSEWTLYKKTKK